MLLYAITSRALLAESEAERTRKLVAVASEWAAGGVDLIQIRENDLSGPTLTRLAAEIVRAVRQSGFATRVFVNASAETGAAIALESGADGVHLRGGLAPEALASAISLIRRDLGSSAPISVSCHSVADVEAARAAGATLALFAPVFEKVLPGALALVGQGLESLAAACQAGRRPTSQPELPVVALGGVARENAAHCIAAGAVGIAGIRLFMQKLQMDGQDWRGLG